MSKLILLAFAAMLVYAVVTVVIPLLTLGNYVVTNIPYRLVYSSYFSLLGYYPKGFYMLDIRWSLSPIPG